MSKLSNISSVAKYESKLLMRSWFYRIFLVVAVLALCIFNFANLVNTDNSGFWIMRALSSNIPYINLLLLNAGQAVIAVFLSSEFLKSDKKLDTSEVFYVHPLSNAEYVIGKIWGNMNVFIRLNLIIICMVVIFNFVSGLPIDWMAYITYFFVISIPTLIYIFGLSIGMMLILKNQAITFVVLLGYIALTLFYIADKFYYLFDYMAYSLPLVKSSFVGFTNWSTVINHRLIYLLIGLGFICVSISLFRRLPNTNRGRNRWLAVSFCFIFAGLFAGYRHVHTILQSVDMRAKYTEINNKYVHSPQMVIDKYDITVEQHPSTISATVVMHGTAQDSASVFIFCLNPALAVRGITENGKDLSFTRDHQIILVDFGRSLSKDDTTTLKIAYDGRIDERFCYLDVLPELLQEKFSVESLFNVDKKYCFQTENYVLFTPETYWYPRPGVAYSSENPDWQRAYFSNYRLTVKTLNGLQAISQGTRKLPAEKKPTIRSNEYDSSDKITPRGGMRSSSSGMYMSGGGSSRGGIGGAFGGGMRSSGQGGGGSRPSGGSSGGDFRSQRSPSDGGGSRQPSQEGQRVQSDGNRQQSQSGQGGQGEGNIRQQGGQGQGEGNIRQQGQGGQGGGGVRQQIAQMSDETRARLRDSVMRIRQQQGGQGGEVRPQQGQDNEGFRPQQGQGQGQRQRQSPEEFAKAQTERMEQLLGLTADQKAKIQEINHELTVQTTAQIQSNQGNRDNIRAIMQEADKKRDEKYKSVLTADQFEKYMDEMVRMRQGGGGGGDVRAQGQQRQDGGGEMRVQRSQSEENTRQQVPESQRAQVEGNIRQQGQGETQRQSSPQREIVAQTKPDTSKIIGSAPEKVDTAKRSREGKDSIKALAEAPIEIPKDTLFIFETDFPTPAISLIIGDYEQKCVEADRTIYSLWHLKGNDYFSSTFETLFDTIPYQIRIRRQEFESAYSLNYSFKRFSLIEVPVQFSSYVRAWTQAQEVIQPEMALFPEKGCLNNSLDVARQVKLQKAWAKRDGRELSDRDAALRIMNMFFMSFQRSESRGDFSIERGSVNVTAKANPYFIFPQLYNFRYNIFSSEWTIGNRLIELYLQDKADNPFMRMLNGISNNEKANLLIQQRPFKELLIDPEQRDLLDNIISLKANVLFAPAELKLGYAVFRDSLRAYLNANRFTNVRFEDLLDKMSAIAGEDLTAPMATWDAPTQLPVYIVGTPEITYIQNRDAEAYVVQLQITNDSDYDGIINVETLFGGSSFGSFGSSISRGSFSGMSFGRSSALADPRAKRKVSLAARETKLLVNVWEDAPRGINVNTLISANLPNQINIPANNIIRERNVPIAKEGDFVLSNVVYNLPGEVIVDNEDAGLFELSKPDIVGLLPQWLDQVGDNSFPYQGVSGRRPPLQWTLTTNDKYYGTHIRSAYVIKSGSGNQTATWKVPVPSTGLYDLYFYVVVPEEIRRDQMSSSSRGGSSSSSSRGGSASSSSSSRGGSSSSSSSSSSRGGSSGSSGSSSSRGGSPSHFHNTGRVEYDLKVRYDNDEDKANVNLERASEGWNLVGTYYFSEDTIKVVLTNNIANIRMVTADAVKIVKRETSSTKSENVELSSVTQ